MKDRGQLKGVRISGNTLHVTVPEGVPNIVPLLRQQLQDVLVVARATGVRNIELDKTERKLLAKMERLREDVKHYVRSVRAAKVDPEMPAEQRNEEIYEMGKRLGGEGGAILTEIAVISRTINSRLYGTEELLQPGQISLERREGEGR